MIHIFVIELNRKQNIIDQEPSQHSDQEPSLDSDQEPSLDSDQEPSGDSNQGPRNQKSIKIKRLII